jgi:alanyl-tRNA synthetase
MRAAEIRRRFLEYFERNGHAIRPSSSLVPQDDPTLLFTNAGMVQFKKVFLGLEEPPGGKRRATTSQKCVRAGGKHNDLEQVGHTARHLTFFEMLGNFSFGDYFKKDAIRFAWEFVTKELGLDRKLLRVTVHQSDDEARALWRDIAKLPDSRIYGLGDKDNFWQMADTGPCGPCSEIFIDLAHVIPEWRFPKGATGEWTELDREEFSLEAFVEGSENDRFIEFWNLVFMQYDQRADGSRVPLPKPSVDTGAGLERISAFMQGTMTVFHTDLFKPLIAEAERVIGKPYWQDHDPSFHVLADHARAVAFLIADGVHPSNEGRGYVLRRILRRAVRHAWLLGRRTPTLTPIVETVVDAMSDVYAELREKKALIRSTSHREEEAFLATIEGGLTRFDQIAPVQTADGSRDVRGTISGDDAFRLYDTYGFPIDLTELMARERGYTVDLAGFESALETQRRRSQEERKSRKLGVDADVLGDLSQWETAKGIKAHEVAFVGYDTVEIETNVAAIKRLEKNRVAMLLRETPFYAESGGQIADRGEIVGEGWRLDVDDVKKIDGRSAALGTLQGTFKFGRVTARVPTHQRKDTERNHTATHLLHAALREVLGEAVHQAGSLVAPDRLRFDFTHHGPVKPEKLEEIERTVNHHIWRSRPVVFHEMPFAEARAAGAMALFGEKYGDVVRVVTIPGFSMELCGGTHVKNTAEIGLFRILHETGVASGVRRIEAATGPVAFQIMRDHERVLARVGEALKAPEDGIERRLQALLEERRALERRVDEAKRGGGGDQLKQWLSEAEPLDGNGTRYVGRTVIAGDVKELQALGDALREQLRSGVGVLGTTFADGKSTLLVVVTDDLKDRGVRADALVREIAAVAGGKGGGKPHMAQAGIPDAAKLETAIREAPAIIRPLLTRS